MISEKKFYKITWPVKREYDSDKVRNIYEYAGQQEDLRPVDTTEMMLEILMKKGYLRYEN